MVVVDIGVVQREIAFEHGLFSWIWPNQFTPACTADPFYSEDTLCWQYIRIEHQAAMCTLLCCDNPKVHQCTKAEGDLDVAAESTVVNEVKEVLASCGDVESVIRGVKCALDSAENMLTAFSIGTTSEYSVHAYGVPIVEPCGVVDFGDVQSSNDHNGHVAQPLLVRCVSLDCCYSPYGTVRIDAPLESGFVCRSIHDFPHEIFKIRDVDEPVVSHSTRLKHIEECQEID